MQPIEKTWLRGKDLNLRPLGYEFNVSFWQVRPVRRFQQLIHKWFRLFLLALHSNGSNRGLHPERQLPRHIHLLSAPACVSDVSMSGVSWAVRDPSKGHTGLQQAGQILDPGRLAASAGMRRLRKAETIEYVRMRRQSARQNVGFSSRPFVLCGLPIKCPPAGTLVHERRNSQFVLRVTGHPSYGLPWGQNRLVPLFLATLATRQRSRRITFASATEMLDTFGMQQGGSQYRRLVGAFQCIFGATIFFGTDARRSISRVVHEARFHFMSEARIWYSQDPVQQNLPGDCQNLIILTEEFYQEILEHPIPTDLEAAKALSSSPAALDLFNWLRYRCFVAKGEERICLFGEFGLASQLGCGRYSRPRRFRERLEQCLTLVHVMWPECPARISPEGQYLLVNQTNALSLGGGVDVCA